MTKKITCPTCNGMTKTLVKKGTAVKMVPCKQCKGKGKVDAPAPARVKKVVKAVAVRKGAKPKATVETPRAGSVRSVSRDMESGHDVSMKLTPEQVTAKDTIEERAAFFGCPGKVTSIRKGPVITLYEFKPSKTTRIKRLINLQEDLALALSADAVMVRRIPGKDLMGIEISNEQEERQNVAFRASLASVIAAKKAGAALPLNLGTDPFGDPIVDDLAVMPHLLIAGSTGSGKSVALNCIISSLLTVCSPEELEFYMIDPKGVELTHYNGIPHMKVPMVTSPHYAKDMLENLVVEMRARLQLLVKSGVRDIKEHNLIADKGLFPKMPRIVCIIDELGDLMMQDRRAFTRLIAEISGMARATGIHMICATHRPSVDVLSGKVKVNFPARMAFKVTSSVDSRTIVHRKGAEALLGRGDMLYLSPTRSTTIRIHAPWVPINDVKVIADKLREMERQRVEKELSDRILAQQERERQMRKQEADGTLPPSAAPRTLKPGQEEDMPIDIGWASITKKS